MSRSAAQDPHVEAASWYRRVEHAHAAGMPHETELPPQPAATLAAFFALALERGDELRVYVPSDEWLPELSNQLDLSIRPLCLILPQAEFARGTALRATLSLLKSRLWRDGDDSRGPAWMRQRERLDVHQATWQEALSWLAESGTDRIVDVSPLYPLIASPFAPQVRETIPPAMLVVLLQCEPPAELDPSMHRILRIGCPARTPDSRDLAPTDDSTPLLIERARLTQDIADLELELASIQSDLAEFTAEYYRRVGKLMAELDALQADVTAARSAAAPENATLRSEAERLSQQARESADESARFASAIEAPAPHHSSLETKRLFRRLAQQIHPDRASDEEDRSWRTRLMSEANRAYREGDLTALEDMFALCRENPPGNAVPREAGVAVIESQLRRLRARMSAIEQEMHRLFGSQLYELFIASRQAGRQGRDLLGEMADRIEESIARLQAAAT